MDAYKPTFLFIKNGMMIGGIEVYLERLIKWLQKNDYRVIYLKLAGTKIHPDFYLTLYGKGVEIYDVDIHIPGWQKTLKPLLREDELVIAYAFDLYQYAMLEKLKIYFKLKNMNSFFWVPHFAEVFKEEKFPKFMKKIIGLYFGMLIKELDDNRNIIYVNSSHLEAFEKQYKFQSSYGKNMLIVAEREEPPKLDESIIKMRAKRKPFKIVTMGRFSFPHKGYVIGLLDAFEKLKKTYTDMTITIIGYGKDEEQLKTRISKLLPEVKKDVILVGAVSPSEQERYFQMASVHIGVAGCIVDSAYYGLISIPVRHYTYECEGYGYFTNMKEKELLVSDKPGQPIERFIEELIEMSDEEYIELSNKTQSIFSNGECCDFGLWEMRQRNIDCSKHLPYFFIELVQMRFILAKIRHGIGKNKKWKDKKNI